VSECRARAVLARAGAASDAQRLRALRSLPPPAIRAIGEEWSWQARRGQRTPDGDWPVWLMLAGRGFGKTRAGAEWVWAQARAHPEARIALIGGTIEEVAKVMVEGESGLLACARSGEQARWYADAGELHFPSGAVGYAWSAARPDKLRGPQHHFAWADEIAKWPQGEEAWDNLMLGLRLGERPRAVITTTPRQSALLRRIRAIEGMIETGGRTADNPHLSSAYREAMERMFAGTPLGRQELDGVMLDEAPGALWTRAGIEARRAGAIAPGEAERVVIGIDPPASANGTCGIVACGMLGGRGYVLGDHSVAGASPHGWARKAAAAAAAWRAGRIVAEANNGGDMVAETLRAGAPAAPVMLVHASRGKAARAEPIACRFENGEAWFAGIFPELEDELCTLSPDGAWRRSPDRADAMVWAMTALFAPRAEPRVLAL
jgi:phage terminase large subunit-like protein